MDNDSGGEIGKLFPYISPRIFDFTAIRCNLLHFVDCCAKWLIGTRKETNGQQTNPILRQYWSLFPLIGEKGEAHGLFTFDAFGRNLRFTNTKWCPSLSMFPDVSQHSKAEISKNHQFQEAASLNAIRNKEKGVGIGEWGSMSNE